MSNDLDQIRQTARAIEIAWSITRDGEEFAQEIENRGLILVYVSREEGKDSHRARAFAGEIDGQRRELKEDLAVVDRHGNVTSIDQRTTGDQWEKIQKRLARIDRRKLVSVAEARDIMADANRAEFREKKRGEQDAARAVAVAEKKILDADNAAQSLDQELSPEDCLHHCRFSLTKLEYEIAISKIKLYGLTKCPNLNRIGCATGRTVA